jgi:DNA-binding MarR family transcriptional regulator
MSDAKRLREILHGLVRRFSISERADVQCCGMTVAQAATLEALEREGALRLGRLSELLGISPSTLTRNLARLEESGHVAREPDPGDGRAHRVRLTAKGKRAAERLETVENDFAAAVLARLQPGQRQLALETLTALLEAVRLQTESCCPGAFDHLVQLEETHV